MQNLIDSTYFWGELELGNLFGSNTSSAIGKAGANADNELNMFIAKYQKVFLTDMFGEDLASELPEELQALIIDEETKTSPLANFVYCFIRQSKATYTTAMGEKKLNAPNTVIVSQDAKIYFAMRECIDKCVKIHDKLYDDETIDVTINNETITLNYLNDIYPKINLNSVVFEEGFNIFGL